MSDSNQQGGGGNAQDKEKRHRGNRGGVRKKMAMANGGGGGPVRSYPRPPFISGANAVMPYGPPRGPYPGSGISMGTGLGMGLPRGPPTPQKFGFFDQPATAGGIGRPGFEKRADAALRPPGMLEGTMNARGGPVPTPAPVPAPTYSREQLDSYLDVQPSADIPPQGPMGYGILPGDKDVKLMAPPIGEQNGAHQSMDRSISSGDSAGVSASGGMNELFAKMVWKKLDMIQSPIRLSRLHTEIMNILQLALAEESSRSA